MEKKEKDFASDIEIEITKVNVKAKHETGEVSKVEFETNKGKITWKPKAEKTEMVRGIAKQTIAPCLFDDLPEKVFEIAREANDKGLVRVKASYSIWNTEKDGEPVTYRFVMGSVFDKWQIIKKEATEEQVG